MECVDVVKLINEIYKMTFYGEPTDFHGMDESDISFIPTMLETSFLAEDVLRKTHMNICNVCKTKLTISVAVSEVGYFLERSKCKLCGSIGWREPKEYICLPCCDMRNICCICQRNALLPVSPENMPQCIMTDFVKNNIKKLSKHRQALIHKAISNRWRHFYLDKKISSYQAATEVEAILKYFLEKPEPKCLL